MYHYICIMDVYSFVCVFVCVSLIIVFVVEGGFCNVCITEAHHSKVSSQRKFNFHHTREGYMRAFAKLNFGERKNSATVVKILN